MPARLFGAVFALLGLLMIVYRDAYTDHAMKGVPLSGASLTDAMAHRRVTRILVWVVAIGFMAGGLALVIAGEKILR